ncbi:uncharacterized protein LOC101856376 [Aplysia californica]|uniref:Uncharacterized protein LOC101856376 n=1 Tax=Aplysia californica TaxID=6500 RepID=A0ABM0K451_APLCA|nr:uncharacterized protein LOC101856376 [Aplysia californica]XP_005108324.1 uncharacterized protein LOC101856376 [Aplysia californica]XP_005108325.1 uncharacterized protein LOC101856376 [Aplysia californica]XP_012943477.1 uncharacterized protein LOC101856376 [Aplysia californica]
MVAITARIQHWHKEISEVMEKPRLMVTVIVIGFFNFWLASEQVRMTLHLLQYMRLAEPRDSQRLLDRYFLFGLSIFAFVWLDLMILNLILIPIRNNVKPRAERRNPVRSCRKTSSA